MAAGAFSLAPGPTPANTRFLASDASTRHRRRFVYVFMSLVAKSLQSSPPLSVPPSPQHYRRRFARPLPPRSGLAIGQWSGVPAHLLICRRRVPDYGRRCRARPSAFDKGRRNGRRTAEAHQLRRPGDWHSGAGDRTDDRNVSSSCPRDFHREERTKTPPRWVTGMPASSGAAMAHRRAGLVYTSLNWHAPPAGASAFPLRRVRTRTGRRQLQQPHGGGRAISAARIITA
jgi:hypothetical protein